MSDTDDLGLGDMAIGANVRDESHEIEPLEKTNKLIPIKEKPLTINWEGRNNIADLRKAGLEPCKFYRAVRIIPIYTKDADGNIVGIEKGWMDVNNKEILSHAPFAANDAIDDREDGVSSAFFLGYSMVHVDLDPENNIDLIEPSKEITSKMDELCGMKFWNSGLPHRKGGLGKLTDETHEAFKANGFKLNESGSIVLAYKGVKIEFRVCLSKDKSMKVFPGDNGPYKGDHKEEHAKVNVLNKATVDWLCKNCAISGSGISRINSSNLEDTKDGVVVGEVPRPANTKPGKTDDTIYIKLNSTGIQPQGVKNRYRRPVLSKIKGLLEEFRRGQLLYSSFVNPNNSYLYQDHKENFWSEKCETRKKHAIEGLKRLKDIGFIIKHDMSSNTEDFKDSMINIRWQLQNDQSIDKLNMQRALDLLFFYYCDKPFYYEELKGNHNTHKYELNWYDNSWITEAHNGKVVSANYKNMFTMPLTQGPNKGETKFRFDPKFW